MAHLTDSELLDRYEYYLMQLEERLLEGEDFQAVGDQMPMPVHYVSPKRLSSEVKDFGKMTKKVEQIVKMDEFKLKHFKRFQQLTDREVEILTLLANGCNNPQIAERLFISRSTVETHRKHLKRKLEIRSLLDLMRYAFAFDLIEY